LENNFRSRNNNCSLTFGIKRSSQIFIANLLQQINERPKLSHNNNNNIYY
ncbi:12470_t:CDS:1, partial [Entrophospora sp. SA101]